MKYEDTDLFEFMEKKCKQTFTNIDVSISYGATNTIFAMTLTFSDDPMEQEAAIVAINAADEGNHWWEECSDLFVKKPGMTSTKLNWKSKQHTTLCNLLNRFISNNKIKAYNVTVDEYSDYPMLNNAYQEYLLAKKLCGVTK